jgi:hypothetical protein
LISRSISASLMARAPGPYAALPLHAAPMSHPAITPPAALCGDRDFPGKADLY